jgi:hypothetical protein
VALVLATVPATFLAYFSQWPQLPVTQGIYDYGAVAIHQAVLAHSDEDTPIYLPLARLNAQPLLFYLSDTYHRQAALTAAPAERALIIAPPKNAADAVWVRLYQQQATILPPLTAEGQQIIQSALAGESAQPIRTRRGEEVARLAPLPTDPAQFLVLPTQILTAAFGPARLTGAAYPVNIDSPAGQLPVTLYWQADQPMTDEFEVLLQLVDDRHRMWGDGTARPNDWVYPTTFWRPGLDEVAGQQTITFEPDTLPPGRYWLAVSLYDAFAGERLPLTAPNNDSPDTLFIGPLKVPLSSPPLSAEQPDRGEATFGEMIKLAGYELPTSQIAAGQPVQINLFWQAIQTPPLDYTVLVHLLDAQNNLVVGSDTQPVNNNYPTTIWSPGEQIFDPHTLSIPADLPPGLYRLAVGLYYQPTGQRLPLRRPDGRLDETGQFILPVPVTVINNP